MHLKYPFAKYCCIVDIYDCLYNWLVDMFPCTAEHVCDCDAWRVYCTVAPSSVSVPVPSSGGRLTYTCVLCIFSHRRIRKIPELKQHSGRDWQCSQTVSSNLAVRLALSAEALSFPHPIHPVRLRLARGLSSSLPESPNSVASRYSY